MIARNLVDSRALLTRIEATSSSLESKKKEVCKLEKPQINNEDIEKILIQLVGAIMEVGYFLKCQIVVLIFLVLLS